MGNLGWTEIFFIAAFALIVFGPRKLPEIARSFGRTMAQLRRASEDFKRAWEAEVEREERLERELKAGKPAKLEDNEHKTRLDIADSNVV
ncbi:MAG: twin-arginine translocase TatA/TatE family subunit [Acidobacteriota bacterium]|nr:twin-arginine translocase TatA/TatE family subunit [Blastocatellia bacterium]MDW8413426.1 twin-arginine translocase TatA/TatE family subunit [Acidobacteriota bacterium]